jgi:WD40 repeat protein
VSPDGQRAVSGSRDKTLRLWDLKTGACVRTLEGHTGCVNRVSVSPDWRLAFSGGGGSWSGDTDYALRLWDLETGGCLRTFEGHRDTIWSVSVTPDGRRAVSGSCDMTLRLWNLETGACLRTFEGHRDTVMRVSVSPDGRRAVSGSDYQTLRVWDLETGQCLRTLEGHADGVRSVSPDGRRAVSVSWGKTLRVWDLETGQGVAVYHAGSRVATAILSPDGRRIVCGTEDGQIHFFTPVNFPPSGPPLVTPVRLWLFGEVHKQADGAIGAGPGRWDESLTAVCASCGRRFPVRDDMLGKELPCSLECCGKPLQLNAFVVDGRGG